MRAEDIEKHGKIVRKESRKAKLAISVDTFENHLKMGQVKTQR